MLLVVYFVYVLVVWLEERNKVSTIAETKMILDDKTSENNINDLRFQAMTLELNDEEYDPQLEKKLVEEEEPKKFRILLTKPSSEALPQVISGGDHDSNHLDIPNAHYEDLKDDQAEEDIEDRLNERKSSILLEGSVRSK